MRFLVSYPTKLVLKLSGRPRWEHFREVFNFRKLGTARCMWRVHATWSNVLEKFVSP